MPGSDKFIAEIADKLAIRELLERYCDGVNQKDLEILSSCWAEDGVWVVPLTRADGGRSNEKLPEFAKELIKRGKQGEQNKVNRIEGRELIIKILRQALAHIPFDNMMAMPGAIKVDGNEATMRCYQEEAAIQPDGQEIRPRGQYDDQLAKIDGEWKFVRRELTILLKEGIPYPYGGNLPTKS